MNIREGERIKTVSAFASLDIPLIAATNTIQYGWFIIFKTILTLAGASNYTDLESSSVHNKYVFLYYN